MPFHILSTSINYFNSISSSDDKLENGAADNFRCEQSMEAVGAKLEDKEVAATSGIDETGELKQKL